MKRILLILLVAVGAVNWAAGQSLTMQKLELRATDTSAQFYPRKDLNDRPCALLKVECVLPELKFTGNVLGTVEKHDDGCYWVYLSGGTKRLNISHSLTLPLEVDFTALEPAGLTPNATYGLTLSIPEALYAALLGQNQQAAPKKVEPAKTTPPAPKQKEPITVDSKVKIDQSNERVYFAVEEGPKFPGGEPAMYKWIAANIHYPAAAAENGIQGRVTVQALIEKDGSVSEVKVVRSRDPDLDAEAVRVVKSMPKFIPGKMKGIPVRVWYNLPINFKIAQ